MIDQPEDAERQDIVEDGVRVKLWNAGRRASGEEKFTVTVDLREERSDEEWRRIAACDAAKIPQMIKGLQLAHAQAKGSRKD